MAKTQSKQLAGNHQILQFTIEGGGGWDSAAVLSPRENQHHPAGDETVRFAELLIADQGYQVRDIKLKRRIQAWNYLDLHRMNQIAQCLKITDSVVIWLYLHLFSIRIFDEKNPSFRKITIFCRL